MQQSFRKMHRGFVPCVSHRLAGWPRGIYGEVMPKSALKFGSGQSQPHELVVAPSCDMADNCGVSAAVVVVTVVREWAEATWLHGWQCGNYCRHLGPTEKIALIRFFWRNDDILMCWTSADRRGMP
jgi:hypothetical protein